jgi:hypothetical protein
MAEMGAGLFEKSKEVDLSCDVTWTLEGPGQSTFLLLVILPYRDTDDQGPNGRTSISGPTSSLQSLKSVRPPPSHQYALLISAEKVIPTTSPNPSPTSLKPLIASTADKGLKLLLRSYEGIIENARYGKCEPNEGDALACEKLVDVITVT